MSNRIIFVLSILGLGVSLYLVRAHLGAANLVCSDLFQGGCERVALHPTAHSFGLPSLLREWNASWGSYPVAATARFLDRIPTAAYGAIVYLALLLLSVVRAAGMDARGRAALAQWVLALMGFMVSLWLTYLEAFVIHAWCQWCIASAVIVTAIFLLSSAERLHGLPAAKEKRGEILG